MITPFLQVTPCTATLLALILQPEGVAGGCTEAAVASGCNSCTGTAVASGCEAVGAEEWCRALPFGGGGGGFRM